MEPAAAVKPRPKPIDAISTVYGGRLGRLPEPRSFLLKLFACANGLKLLRFSPDLKLMILKIAKSLALIPLFVLFGCGSKGPKEIERMKTVPVSGTVTLRGKALADASVVFTPTDGKVNPRGTTDESGNFKLSTYGTDDGAPVGTYKVTVAVNLAKQDADGNLLPPPEGGWKSPIPPKYGDPKLTDITKEVKEGGGPINIDLK